MTIAIWIIAICSVVRIVQNGIQLSMLIGERDLRKQLNNEFIDSLRKDNKEWAEDALKRFVEAEQTEPQMGLAYDDDGTLPHRVKNEPINIIACPIQEEDADYFRWLYEDEQTDCAWK